LGAAFAFSSQHTIFTLFIYGVLGVGNQYNSSNLGIAIKMAVCFLLVFLLWETPGVFKTVFRCIEGPRSDL
jgi:hypothetical protein